MAKQKPKVILMLYGEGGHAKQAERMVQELGAQGATGFASISDVSSVPSWSQAHCHAPELRDKMTGKYSIKAMWLAYRALRQLQQQVQIIGCVSTGPGIAIVPALLLRLRGVKVVHIETWSAFYRKSLTGRVMKRIAHRFIVQNKELLGTYPDAEYGGRL